MRISCLILAVLKEEIPFRCEHFLCYARNGSFHQCLPPPLLKEIRKKFSLDVNISCVMQETKIFHQGLPPSTGSCKEEIFFRFEHFLCYTRNENFSPSPPSTLVLLYCKFLIEIHAVQLDSWIFKEEILFRCEHFLCYGRNENISPRPPPLNWKI